MLVRLGLGRSTRVPPLVCTVLTVEKRVSEVNCGDRIPPSDPCLGRPIGDCGTGDRALPMHMLLWTQTLHASQL